MSLLLVTTTNGRPKAFEALKKWTQSQTTEEYDWLVVTDGWDDYKFTKAMKVIKRDNSEDTLPSICHNWLAALDFIDKNEKYDKIINLDDDDYYAPSYVRETRGLLDKADLAGWHEDAYYYVINRKAKRCHNIGHASLAATAFNRSVLPYLRECVNQGNVFIDLLLWRGIQQRTLMPQPPIKLADGSNMIAPPHEIYQTIKAFTGSRLLVNNFTGIAYGSRQEPELDRAGNVKNERPRHVGMKENWHFGSDGYSTFGHNAAAGGGSDVWGDTLKKWIGEEDANFFLKVTDEAYNKLRPEQAGGTANKYQPGLMLPLPIENDR